MRFPRMITRRRMVVVTVAALGFALTLMMAFSVYVGFTYWVTNFVALITESDNENVHTGEDARARILQSHRRELSPGEKGNDMPASARDFWLYDGGTFNGSITYWIFRCDNRDDCLKAIRFLGNLPPEALEPWKPSRYAVVMEGPDFYWKEQGGKNLRPHPWDVRGITNGLVHERVYGDHRSMVYYAIDLDRNRVYYHYESGGFPPDDYAPDGSHSSRKAKSK